MTFEADIYSEGEEATTDCRECGDYITFEDYIMSTGFCTYCEPDDVMDREEDEAFEYGEDGEYDDGE